MATEEGVPQMDTDSVSWVDEVEAYANNTDPTTFVVDPDVVALESTLRNARRRQRYVSVAPRVGGVSIESY
jgi:hypothetical protein